MIQKNSPWVKPAVKRYIVLWERAYIVYSFLRKGLFAVFPFLHPLKSGGPTARELPLPQPHFLTAVKIHQTYYTVHFINSCAAGRLLDSRHQDWCKQDCFDVGKTHQPAWFQNSHLLCLKKNWHRPISLVLILTLKAKVRCAKNCLPWFKINGNYLVFDYLSLDLSAYDT